MELVGSLIHYDLFPYKKEMFEHRPHRENVQGEYRVSVKTDTDGNMCPRAGDG